MGYSTSIRAIKRVENILDKLVKASSNVNIPTPEGIPSSKLAYYIREGINASQTRSVDINGQSKQPFADYAQLNAKYLFRAHDREVFCELRGYVPPLVETLAEMNIPDVSDTLGILGACLRHKAPTMRFTDATPESVDLNKIHMWAQKAGYHIIAGQDITVTTNDPGELAWKP